MSPRFPGIDFEAMRAANQGRLDLRITGEAGAGMVKLTMNGNGRLVKVEIDKQAFELKDSEMLADLILAAFEDLGIKFFTMAKRSLPIFGDIENRVPESLPRVPDKPELGSITIDEFIKKTCHEIQKIIHETIMGEPEGGSDDEKE